MQLLPLNNAGLIITQAFIKCIKERLEYRPQKQSEINGAFNKKITCTSVQVIFLCVSLQSLQTAC